MCTAMIQYTIYTYGYYIIIKLTGELRGSLGDLSMVYRGIPTAFLVLFGKIHFYIWFFIFITIIIYTYIIIYVYRCVVLVFMCKNILLENMFPFSIEKSRLP